jgi:hypothetical protein
MVPVAFDPVCWAKPSHIRTLRAVAELDGILKTMKW